MSWNTLTGNNGIPASFNWLGYATNQQNGSSNYRYDQAPANPAAFGTAGGTTVNISTGAPAPFMEYYYTVLSTANGSSTTPFSLKSYTFLGTYSGTSASLENNTFGEISVWDFTMNLPNGKIVRSGGDWTVSGSLVVGNGILYFGNNGAGSGNTNVGNVRVLGSGILYMDQTTKPMIVRQDVDLTGGSQFRLSGAIGGDLYVGRNFYVRDGNTTTQGTFQPLQRAVFFTGTNAPHSIGSNIANYELPFSYLFVNTPGSNVVLGTNILVTNELNFNQGLITTGSYYVKLDGAVGTAPDNQGLLNETADSHIVGNTVITQTVGTPQSGTKYFGNVGFSLSPQNSTTTLGDVKVTRVTGTALTGVGAGNGSASILRYFVLTTPNAASTGLNLQLQFTYRADEQNNIPASNQALYQSLSGAPGTFLRLTNPGTFTGTTLSYNYTGLLTSGTYFTVGDGVVPLPVTLVSFTATPTAQGAALLHWVTASEANSKGFAVERQLGSGAWQQVGYVAATNAATGSTYDFTDKGLAVAPATALAYYRLRQEDFDGTTSYSPVATVARPALVASTELLLSPVPVTGANLSMTFAEAGQAGLEIAVVNTQGQSLLHFTTEASAETALSLPVEKLAAGVYIVSVRVPGQPVRHARFVKL